MATHDELIAQYSQITGASTSNARSQLEAFDWSLELAMEDYYAQQQDSDVDPEFDEQDDEPEVKPAKQPQTSAAGGHRLGDATSAAPVPASAAPSSAKPRSSAPKKKFATLGDFGSNNKDDSDSDDEPENLYAGGDKSGLAVQNPDNQRGSEDLKKKIIEKARRSGKEQAKEDETKKTSFFTGNAQTLGGDDAPSQEIRGEQQEKAAERVKRTLHFWSDGFSIDDGELYRFDDPANAQILQQIRGGRAPLHIMNVGHGQEVDVNVLPHEENYVKPKAQYKPFGGSGTRLGSPTPASSSNSAMPGSFTQEASVTSSSTPAVPTSQIDESRPTITIRISLGSGTRLTSKFNTDQTIGDVYDFVRRAETGGRSFVLQTTFPTKEFTDEAAVLGDLAEFKRGGAVVQKYV